MMGRFIRRGGTTRRLATEPSSQRRLLFVVGACIVVYVALSIYAPAKSASIIDDLWAAVQRSWQQGTTFEVTGDLRDGLIMLSAVYALTWLAYYLQSWLMASVAETLVCGLRRRVADKINVLPLRFFDRNKPGEVLSRVTNDLDKVSETLQTGLLELFRSAGTIVGALVMMFVYSVPLTLTFLLFMAASMIVTARVARQSLAVATARQETLGALTGIVEEYYTGRTVIRSYNREASSSAMVHEAVAANRVAAQRADALVNCVNPLVRLVSRLAQGVIAVIAGAAMIRGTMSVGTVQAFFQYMSLTSEPLTQASYMFNSMQSALASARRIFELLDEAEEDPDVVDPITIDRARGEVAFEHVRFGYDPDHILMHDVSFKAMPGQALAVVGATGAGKTTLINLLMRFYEVNGGTILLDGVDTGRMTRAGLRANFGMVLQDAWLFGGTVADNIAYGRPEATREEVELAARAAHADYFICTMPRGYDSLVDDQGSSLSVGQRQLLTIARVFLCDPPILILDEATSSVDTRTEAEIGRAMSKLMAGRTSFVIAHRLSTIRDADSILVMEHGTIIEQGNHAQLMKANGAYASLYESQFE
jgi:ATP-binding cassette subfamily B protein